MNRKINNLTDDPASNPRHHLRKITATTAEIADLYFKDGLPIKKIGDKLGISGSSVASRLKLAGYTLRPGRGGPRPKVSIDVLVSMYFNDLLSTNEIADRVGLHGETIRRRLRGAGYTLRNNVAARDMRAWRMSDIERRLTFGGTNRASQQAITKERNALKRKKIPPNETLLLDRLRQRGISELVQQKAVGIYNMDFAAGPVGIEVIGGRCKPTGFASSAERIYFILKSGFHLIELLYREPLDPFKESAVDEVVAFLEHVESLPPGIRQYRMIGGSGQLLAVFETDLNN